MQTFIESFVITAKNIAIITTPLALLLSADPAKAVLNVTIFDDGPDLKVEATGNLSELGIPIGNLPCTVSGAIISPYVICTGVDISSPLYSISGSVGFGGIALLAPADFVTGPFFGINAFSNFFAIDSSYVVGQPFLSSATFNNTSLAAQGFTVPGLAGTWTIDGTSESINVFIGPPPTPPSEVPGPLPLLGAGAAFGWSRRMRRRIATPLTTHPQA